MSRIRSRTVLAGVVCATIVTVAGVSMAAATTTPPEDTSTSESSAPSGSAASTDTTDGPGSDGGGLEILPPAEEWGGASRGEWDARWWQWALSMPLEVNPNFDPTGESCGYGQFGPVFFLPGNFGGEASVIRCVVAEGTAIYATPAGAECSTVEPPPFFGRDEDELRACAAAAVDEVEDYEATIDGQEVSLEGYRTTSPLFTLTLPEDNFFGLEPGVGQAVSEGYGFIIAPPPPGEYEITLSVTFVGDPQQYASRITLVVEEPQVIEPPGSTELGSTAPGSTGPVDSRPDANVQRYCALVQELDEAGVDAFAELEADESATDEDFAEAERQFIEDHRAEFDELREVAPAEIANDIDVLLDAQEQRAAGGEQEDVTDEVAAAEERVGAFEEEHCTAE